MDYYEKVTRLHDRAHSLESKAIFDQVNVKDYGAVGDGVTDDLAAITAAIAAAQLSSKVVHFGEGTFVLTGWFPTRQDTVVTVEDLGGLVIEGEGKNTIIKTISSSGNGLDVFQLNGVSNLTIRNLGVHSEIDTDTATSGSNAFSFTGGSSNITVDNVHVYEMPYVVTGDGSSLDGGDAFGIQQGTSAFGFSNITIRNCVCDGGSYGFLMNTATTQAGVLAYPMQGIAFQNNRVSNFFKGISVELDTSDGATPQIPDMSVLVSGNTIIDCQLGLNCNGASNVNMVGNTVISTLTGEPTYVTNVARSGILALSNYNCNIISNVVNMAESDYFALIGGGYQGIADTPNYDLNFIGNNFSGTTDATYTIQTSTNAAYQYVKRSNIIGNTGPSAYPLIDATLKTISDENIILSEEYSHVESLQTTRLGVGKVATTGIDVSGSYPTGYMNVERTGTNGVGTAGVAAIKTDAKTVSDAISIAFIAKDSADNDQTYGKLNVVILDPTSGSEDSKTVLTGVVGGSNVDLLAVQAGTLSMLGTQILSGRKGGYTDPTGTSDKSTFATTTVTTENLAEFVKALYEDLKTHGLIGN